MLPIRIRIRIRNIAGKIYFYKNFILYVLQVLWSGNYGSIFEATMSLNRFRFLAADLRFDDPPQGRLDGLAIALQL